MGRKSGMDLFDWLEKARAAKDNEQAVMLVLKLMLEFGDLRRVLGVPKISGHRFEFPVRGGRIDLLLFHPDQSVTIVEAKADFDQRTIAGGIGQLCMYAALLPSALNSKQRPTYIRRILCTPVAPTKSLDLMTACDMAGVKFVHMPSFDLLKSRVNAIGR